MRKLFAAMLCLALLTLPGWALGETRLMVVSDLPYLAPELYRGSELFLRALRAGDGKITQYGEELMSALTAQAAALQPDALIVTGDLSFNGEKASHEGLAEWFRRIEASGVPVWVIPGNHDVNTPEPRAFRGSAWEWAESTTEEDFSAIYAEFMGEKEDGNANLSYHVRLNDTLWLALADVSYYHGGALTFGLFTAGHAQWLKDVLQDAARAGAETIFFTHHSLIAHTQFGVESYQMIGHEGMAEALRASGARLNLSGHLHIQHVAEEGGLTDAATGAFCVTPHRFVLITLADDGAITYEARALDDEYLPEGFQAMSREWFASITAEKSRASLAALNLPEADLEAMLDYLVRFNLAYFSGEYDDDDPAWREGEGYRLWRAHADDDFGKYLNLVMDEENGDNLYRVLLPREK